MKLIWVVSLLVVIVLVKAAPPIYNDLAEVGRSQRDLTRIDNDNDGIVDEANWADHYESVEGVPDGCLEGYLLKGFESDGTPKCTRMALQCAAGPNHETICQLIDAGSSLEATMELIQFTFSATDSTTAGPESIEHSSPVLALPHPGSPSLCSWDNDAQGRDHICLNEYQITETTNSFIINATITYMHSGGSYLTGLSITGSWKDSDLPEQSYRLIAPGGEIGDTFYPSWVISK